MWFLGACGIHKSGVGGRAALTFVATACITQNMGADLFICPKEDAAPITVEQIRERLVTAGLPCNIETHDGDPWIVFDGRQSDLVFTVETDGRAGSAVMQASLDDDPAFGDRVFDVFESFNWSYVEDTF